MTSTTTPVPGQRGPELTGQTVVVIGGSAGIGLETARRARAEGADVILTGRDPDRLNQAALEVGAQRTAAFDATDTAALRRFFQDLPAPILDRISGNANAYPGFPTDFQLFTSNRAWSAVYSGFEVQIDDNARGDSRESLPDHEENPLSD